MSERSMSRAVIHNGSGAFIYASNANLSEEEAIKARVMYRASSDSPAMSERSSRSSSTCSERSESSVLHSVARLFGSSDLSSPDSRPVVTRLGYPREDRDARESMQ